MKLIGYDAYKAQVEALQGGVFSALIAQRPGDEAKLALEYAVDVLKGNKNAVKKSVVIPNIVMTKENFADTSKYEYVE